jgi:hypothetical protein
MGRMVYGCMTADLSRRSGQATGLENVVTVLAAKVARRSVVADSVPRLQAENGTGRAFDRGAAELGGALPHNLGEVAPVKEVGAGRRVVRAIEAPVVDLTVVPLGGNSALGKCDLLGGDVAAVTGGSQVLAVTAVALVHVMLEHTALGSVEGVLGKSRVPSQIRR